MARVIRTFIVVSVLAGFIEPAAASVEVVMTIEGLHGTFSTGHASGPNTVAVTGAQLDLMPKGAGTPVAPRPVVVLRKADENSWHMMQSLSLGEALRVSIITTQSDQDSAVQHRRIVTLYGARILSIHAASVTADDQAAPIGTEAITFTYDRLELEEDGATVFTWTP